MIAQTEKPTQDVPIRIRIWNDCKRRGMSDDAAYREIRRKLGDPP